MEVRTALGANRLRIIRQLLTESCVLSSAGAAAGLVVAWFSQSVIVSIGASLTTYVVAPAVLLLTAVAASYLPARRAARVDPVIALRSE